MDQPSFPDWIGIITIHWDEEDNLWQVAIMSDEPEAAGKRVDGFGKTKNEAWYQAWDKAYDRRERQP